jgi:hypothetical protein
MPLDAAGSAPYAHQMVFWQDPRQVLALTCTNPPKQPP